MTDIPVDKRKTSVESLRSANKHLTDLFRAHDNLTITVEEVQRQLEHIKSKVGNIYIDYWNGNGYIPKPLASILAELKNKLEGAK